MTTPTSTCTHCGLPLAGGKGEFCCGGCRLVHGLLGRGRDGEGPPPDRLLARVVLAAFLSMGVMVFTLSLYGLRNVGAEELEGTAGALRGLLRLGALAFSVPVLALLGPPLVDALRGGGRWRSADGLVLVGVGAAWTVSLWNTFADTGEVYFETATMVLVLVTVGRWLDVRVRTRARSGLTRLVQDERRPVELVARPSAPDGGVDGSTVDVEALLPGDLVRLRPGDLVPADGRVASGRSFVDESLLTGEERPRSVGPGDVVLDGTHLVDGSLDVEVERANPDSTRAEIERLLAESLARRPGLVRAADRVAGVFLPAVLVVAAATFAWHASRGAFEPALLNALSVLLISCPCALGLATPLAFWSTLGAAWREGLLVRGGDVLERLARARRAFLDKTGTLTTGRLDLVDTEVLLPGESRESVLRVARAVEARSEHPIAEALRRGPSEAKGPEVKDFRVLPGRGVEARVDGARFALLRDDHPTDARTRVLLTREDEPLARFALAARLRPEAAGLVRLLAAEGLSPVVLTGDGPGPAAALAERLDVPVEPSLLPADKVERIARAGRRGSLFVGEGLNDGAALAAADVGIAVRGAAPLSLDSASVALLRDDLLLVPELLLAARRAVATARVNLLFAFAYNVVGIGLAATGRLSPVFAAAAMVASSLAVCLNAARGSAWPGTPRSGSSESETTPASRREMTPAVPTARP